MRWNITKCNEVGYCVKRHMQEAILLTSSFII